MKKFIVTEDTEVVLDRQKYLLESGDRIIIKEFQDDEENVYSDKDSWDDIDDPSEYYGNEKTNIINITHNYSDEQLNDLDNMIRSQIEETGYINIPLDAVYEMFGYKVDKDIEPLIKRINPDYKVLRMDEDDGKSYLHVYTKDSLVALDTSNTQLPEDDLGFDFELD